MFLTYNSIQGTYGGIKNNILLISQNLLYYLSLNFKFSSLLYSSSLSDIFAYELPVSEVSKITKSTQIGLNTSSSIVVYNFHSLLLQERFLIFVKNTKNCSSEKSIPSLTELFPNS